MRCRCRYETAGAQYRALASARDSARAIGLMKGDAFHEIARPSTIAAAGHGRQLRSESASTATGIAAKRIRAMFSPIPDGTRYAVTAHR